MAFEVPARKATCLFLLEYALFKYALIFGEAFDAVPEAQVPHEAQEDENSWDKPHCPRDVFKILYVQTKPRINRSCWDDCPQPRAMHLLLI